MRSDHHFLSSIHPYSQPNSPSSANQVSTPLRQPSQSHHRTSPPNKTPNRSPSNNLPPSGSENRHPAYSSSPKLIGQLQNSANSTPTRSDTERRSFQGDHHRHRYMNYSASPSPIRASPQSNKMQAQRSRPSPSQKLGSSSPRNSPHHSNSPQNLNTQLPASHLLANPTQQHLGAPTNAHYSPYYGSSAQRVPTGKRKPAPPISPQHPNSDSSPILRSLSPQTASPNSIQKFSRSAEPSPSRSHSSNGRLSKSRSPSPSPRSVGLAKKIGSVLSAPFKSSSRRGSDASEVGLGLHDTHRIGATSFPGTIAMPLTNSQPYSEYLPSMPTAGTSLQADRSTSDLFHGSHQPLTLAQQLIHETRDRDAMSIVPESPERVLRVVNGLASTSTKSSNHSRANLAQAFSGSSLHDTEVAHSTKLTSRMSLESSSAYCSKCRDLEHKLATEVDRSRALERALEDQTNKLEQLRNWSTAKITTLDHALKAQEKMLQGVERRMLENRQPDIKSDYLIALQKDFVELNARLAALEGKQSEDGDDSPAQDRFPNGAAARSHSSNEAREDFSPSTQPTSFGRATPSSSTSPVLGEEGHFANLTGVLRDRETPRAYSTPPLMVSTSRGPRAQTPQMSTPRKWNPSSPANMASKLVPPTHLPDSSPRTPGSNSNSRSAPVTPTSRSPRPRYTSALGTKAPSPLSFNTCESSRNKTGLNNSQQEYQLDRVSPPPPASKGSYSRITTTNNSKYRQPFEVLNQTSGNQNYLRNTNSSARSFSPTKMFGTTREDISNFHSKRLSVINQNLKPHSSTLTQPLNLHKRGTKPAVGDLIKMFDGSK